MTQGLADARNAASISASSVSIKWFRFVEVLIEGRSTEGRAGHQFLNGHVTERVVQEESDRASRVISRCDSAAVRSCLGFVRCTPGGSKNLIAGPDITSDIMPTMCQIVPILLLSPRWQGSAGDEVFPLMARSHGPGSAHFLSTRCDGYHLPCQACDTLSGLPNRRAAKGGGGVSRRFDGRNSGRRPDIGARRTPTELRRQTSARAHFSLLLVNRT